MNGRESARTEERLALPLLRSELKIGWLLVATFDELRLYDQPLSAAQIAALANVAANEPDPAEMTSKASRDEAVAALEAAGIQDQTDPALPHNPVTQVRGLDRLNDTELADPLKKVPELRFIDISASITDASIPALAALPKPHQRLCRDPGRRAGTAAQHAAA